MTFIRLVRKLAPLLNGLDLSGVEINEVIQVPNAVAEMLIREGWAELPTCEQDSMHVASGPPRVPIRES
jgi:hypothetical protein